MGLVTTCIINSYAMRMTATIICVKSFAIPNTFIVTNIRVGTVTSLSIYTMIMISGGISRAGVIMARHFPNGKLCCTFPHINRNIRRHVIMRLIRARIINCYAMAMTIIKINSSASITTTAGRAMPFPWRKISA